jgi:hypothetical protein
VYEKLSQREKEIKGTMGREEQIKEEYDSEIEDRQSEIETREAEISRLRSEAIELREKMGNDIVATWAKLGLPAGPIGQPGVAHDLVVPAEPGTGDQARRVRLDELVRAGLLQEGETLILVYNTQVLTDEQAHVVSTQNKLKFLSDGRLYSVSKLAKILLQKHHFVSHPYGVQGPLFWQTRAGKRLHELNEEIRRRRGDRTNSEEESV